MIEALKNLLGFGPKVDYATLVKQGAVILDVRTKGEYTNGHIRGSVNIPVDQLNNNTSRFSDKNKVIITCCASGNRSGMAKRILASKGYTQVYNGGGWMSLRNKL
jgi:rhodanese-related sulfurtransferase